MSKWVSVYDALPPPKVKVLVYCKPFISGIRLPEQINVSSVGRGRKFDIEFTESRWTFGRVEVTHWMPLPDPPEQELPPPKRP